MRAKPRSGRGPVPAVTIVELVMVIIVTMILAGASIAGLNGVQSWRAAAAARRLHADFAYARNLAVLSSRRTALAIVDKATLTYELRQEAVPATGALVASVLTHPATGKDWSVTLGGLASGLSLQSSDGPANDVIGFDADGLLIDSSGGQWNGDISLSLSSGATINLTQATGVAELVWP